MNLTAREVQVLEKLALGMSSKEIGKALGMAPMTADKHIEHIREKRGARNRVQLIARYFAERA